MITVALVSEFIDAQRGGAETAALELAGLLAERSASVRVLTRSPAGVASLPPGVSILTLPATGRSRVAATADFLRRVDDRCAGAAFDVVHALLPCRSATVYQPRGGAYPTAIRQSVAMVRAPLARRLRLWLKGWNGRQCMLAQREAELLRRDPPPVVAAISDYVRRQIRQDYPLFPPDALRVIFNGVGRAPLAPAEAAARRTRTRQRFGVAAHDVLLLMVAHNLKLKGYPALLEAARREPTWHVLVAGRQEPPAGPARRIRWLGAAEDMADLFSAADVLAHPTWYDPCSRVVLEALCCGLPVVTTRFNGAAEVVESGVTGFIVDSPADTTALRDAIRQAAALPLPRGAVPHLAERLSMRRHAAELLQLYASILQPSVTRLPQAADCRAGGE